jgi:hypothetical protein
MPPTAGKYLTAVSLDEDSLYHVFDLGLMSVFLSVCVSPLRSTKHLEIT